MHRIYAAPTYTMGGDFIVMPGARLSVGPGGKLYESMGEDEAIKNAANAQAAKAAAENDQKAAAKRELAGMKRSLKGWLKYRRLNDEIASGKREARVPAKLAAQTLSRDRDYAGEQKLADDLYLLLSMVRSPKSLPSPDLSKDQNAAVKLARMAITGSPDKEEVSSPQPTGILPIIILTVGGVMLFTLTSFISNRAEVQKEKERLKCINDGGCTDFGFWLKVASVTVIGYFVWEKLGVGKRIKSVVKGK